MKILGISGSLRAASFNTLLLGAAAACVPSSVQWRMHAIGDLPLYDSDIDTEALCPEAARARSASKRPTRCCSRRRNTTTAFRAG